MLVNISLKTYSDNVADTPNQDYSSEECPDFPFYDDCTASGDGIMFNNYMDYVDDACMNMFTAGQSTRMRAALDLFRYGLIAEENEGEEEEIIMALSSAKSAYFTFYPNPAKEIISIYFIHPASVAAAGIFNLAGQKVLDIKSVDTQIDISKLSNGIYFIRQEGHAESSQKLIISK